MQVEAYRRKEREYVALHGEQGLEKFRKENEYVGSWNPLADLKAYLKEDVAILAEACARHRELFLKTSARGPDTGDGLDPFCGRIVTLASGCYKAFRCNFYDE